MKFVLIFVYMSQYYGSYSVTQEFDTMAACTAAENRLVDNALDLSGRFNATVTHNCWPKG
jgi:hypothetical protein